VQCCFRDPTFSHFDTVLAYDRQTDRYRHVAAAYITLTKCRTG